MFLVLNKSKIYSYLIAFSMVVILFVTVAQMDDLVSPQNETIETSTNIVENVIQNHQIMTTNETQNCIFNQVSE